MADLKFVPIYFDNAEQLAMLPAEQRGQLLMVLIEYAKALTSGEPFELSEDCGLDVAAKIAFTFMAQGIARMYEVSAKRSESGAKGGEAKAKNSKPLANRSKTLANSAEKEKEKEKDKEKDFIKTISVEPLPGSTPVISFMLNDGSLYPISQEQIDEWQTLYPAVDVMQELRNIVGWCGANPSKRKTRKGALRFVNSWLSREQDKPHQGKRKSFSEIADEMESEGWSL